MEQGGFGRDELLQLQMGHSAERPCPETRGTGRGCSVFGSVPWCCRAEQHLPPEVQKPPSCVSSAHALLPLCPPHTAEPAGPHFLHSPSRGTGNKTSPSRALGQQGAPSYAQGEQATAP